MIDEKNEQKRRERIETIMARDYHGSGHDLIDCCGVTCLPDSFQWWENDKPDRPKQLWFFWDTPLLVQQRHGKADPAPERISNTLPLSRKPLENKGFRQAAARR